MSEIEKLKHDIARYIKITSEQADEIERLKEGHCKDCCCARSWEALGNPPYSGTSIPEHIAQLRRELAEARGMTKLHPQEIAGAFMLWLQNDGEKVISGRIRNDPEFRQAIFEAFNAGVEAVERCYPKAAKKG